MFGSASDRPPVWLGVIAVIAMLAMSGWILHIWLWQAFGKEVVTVGNGSLALGKNLFGFDRFARIRRFDIAQIQNLRASGPFGSFCGWSSMLKFYGLTGGVVAFESGGKTHRFGIQLQEDEARQVVQDFQPYLR